MDGGGCGDVLFFLCELEPMRISWHRNYAYSYRINNIKSIFDAFERFDKSLTLRNRDSILPRSVNVISWRRNYAYSHRINNMKCFSKSFVRFCKSLTLRKRNSILPRSVDVFMKISMEAILDQQHRKHP